MSKESGKIGVTITTSSSSSSSSGAGSPPPSKMPRFLPVKNVVAPTSPSFTVSHYEIRQLALLYSKMSVCETVKNLLGLVVSHELERI